MKTWTPFKLATLLAVLINAFPLLMAFVVQADGWKETGWVMYMLLIPAGLGLMLLGFITSMVMFFRRRNA
ncbi:hypothetical protein [Parathalassolituus penaei]|uniref:Uncharacterized protein n=1 Tax=Parathalassolituus penaei TaxID=2997323 RepID=A0A9X3EI28_9GAMM|nr:hypothetical protein [Parathalassolituus penaei]MCY0967120.1 hypothetical protein [Parathalassolituus penaei]